MPITRDLIAPSHPNGDAVVRRPHRVGFWTVVALVMGNMIGSGIFLLPASLAPYGGLSLVGWGVSTGGAGLVALVFARLARLDPVAGGPYAFTRRAFGDLAGFLVAWGYWISIWVTLAALAVALVGYLAPFLPGLVSNPPTAALMAIGVVWLLIGVNLGGVHAAGSVQIVTTILKVAPLAAVGVFGLLHFEPSHFALTQPDVRTIASDVPAVVALTLWAFVGLESATVPADSIHDPERTIPRATLVGTLLAAIVYIGSTVGVMSLVRPSELATSTAPFADAARVFGGNWGAAVIAIGATVSCFGALNGWVLLAGHLPRAVAQDGLFPRIFARSTDRQVPAAAMIIAGVLTTVLVSLNYSRRLVDLFTFFILLATLNTLIPYVFSSLAVFLIPDTSGRQRVTAGAGVSAALAFLFSVWAISGAGQDTVYWGFLLLLCGLPVYVWLRAFGRSVDTAPRPRDGV